ncbi:AraC family transcriptional regulator [Micromonospora sp. KC207]|uniref:AraC family transcriptional regulator n=1 Tax=Micromonospora sp. KC207 TaxID=2530377 RepID=UPI001052B004|nr:AraC family transcriptional regulator [Micromonospora sp. KC207]TDC65748.1 AraC family transcriptional regulator [Micromonospora sp. KC207]
MERTAEAGASICVAVVANTARSLVAVGADPAAVQQVLGFAVDQYIDPDAHVPLAALARLERAAPDLTGDPAVALRLAGRCAADGNVGAIGQLAAHSPSLREALCLAVRHANVLGTGLRLALRTATDRAELSYHRTEAASRTMQGAELALGEIATTLRFLADGADIDLRADFRHERPGHAAAYAAVFGDWVCFGQKEDRITFVAELLDRPPPRAQSYLFAVLREHAVTLAERVAATDADSRQVREHIVTRLPLGPPTAEATSRALGISRQTLYRRLRTEGTTFEQLLDTTRHRLALEHLGNSRYTLHEIATLLGFAEYSSFHRAVRRWTGHSPQTYRRGIGMRSG